MQDKKVIDGLFRMMNEALRKNNQSYADAVKRELERRGVRVHMERCGDSIRHERRKGPPVTQHYHAVRVLL